MNYKSANLPTLVLEAKSISERTATAFGGLTHQQLNWKPSAERWSVGQCLEHLVAAGASYVPIIESVIESRKTNTTLERFPVLPGIFGKLLIKSLDPSTTRKLKAPKRIEPASSEVESSIVRKFVDLQDELISKMQATSNLNLDKIIITSPVASIVTYSLMDAYRIIVVHEERHFQQAQRVTRENAFPM